MFLCCGYCTFLVLILLADSDTSMFYLLLQIEHSWSREPNIITVMAVVGTQSANNFRVPALRRGFLSLEMIS